MLMTPTEMVVVPLKVFAPPRTTVPAPSLFKVEATVLFAITAFTVSSSLELLLIKVTSGEPDDVALVSVLLSCGAAPIVRLSAAGLSMIAFTRSVFPAVATVVGNATLFFSSDLTLVVAALIPMAPETPSFRIRTLPDPSTI